MMERSTVDSTVAPAPFATRPPRRTVKAPPFTYHRPDNLTDALTLLHEHGDDAKVLAGGQSLIPLMALRMGRPAHVVDIGAITSLDSISVADDHQVTIGALVRHEHAKSSPDIATHAPLVARAMPWVAHRAIRTRGTVVGSIAHADPAAEMPAVVLATGATLRAQSVTGTRDIAADEFFSGYLDTALRPDELLTEVIFPPWASNAVCSVAEVARRHGDYALVGVATRLVIGSDHKISDAAMAFFGVGPTPLLATVAAETLIDAPATARTFDAAAQVAAAELDPPGDIHASAAYRTHLATVLARRSLDDATATIGVPA